MKNDYLKPEMEVLEIEVSTMMMTGSIIDTEMGDEPSVPDANGRRGSWGNRWENLY